MSMSEPDIDAPAADPGETGTDWAAQELPRFEASIVPSATVAGRALVAVIAIMTFLAALTTGAVMLVRAAAGDWQSDVGREVTIQVRPVDGRDIDADVGKAAAIARATPGIAGVRPYTKQDSAQLLQPWLGGLALDELPIPRIIAVEIGQDAPPDLAALRAALVGQVPPASLDDHREFVDQMRVVTRTVVAGGLGVLALVIISTVLTVTFATRGMMASNRQVIEVLHFIGAKDGFIAGHFQRHFLLLGVQGGAIGGGCAVLLFGLADLSSGWLQRAAGGAQLGALFGSFSIGVAGYAAVLAQVALIALVTAATSRHTVNRTLAAVQ
jgi:cell division transport system permease protein